MRSTIWGHGELKTAGGSQRFAIKGISVVDVGATGFDASGNVYNLKSLADFSADGVRIALTR
jgi:hypothetical protein